MAEQPEHIEPVLSGSFRLGGKFIGEINGEVGVGVWDFIVGLKGIVEALVKVVVMTPVVVLWVIVGEEVHY